MDTKKILKEQRIKLGLTMKQVSEAVGVSESTISRWESGAIANMTREKIVLLSQALKISPSVIMGWSKEEKEDTIFILDDYKYFEVPRFESIAAGLGVIADSRPIGVDGQSKSPTEAGDFFYICSILRARRSTSSLLLAGREFASAWSS